MILPLEANHLHWAFSLAIRVKLGSLSKGDSAGKKHMFSGRWIMDWSVFTLGK